MLLSYIAVMAGGAVGSAARFWLSGSMAARFGETFPFGTLAVNVLGCLLIGLFTGLTRPDGPLLAPPLLRQFVSIGILGGFTTFSAFSLQTLQLLNNGEWLQASVYTVLSVVVCLACVGAGMMLGTALTSH
jgi:fluoride exporter